MIGKAFLWVAAGAFGWCALVAFMKGVDFVLHFPP